MAITRAQQARQMYRTAGYVQAAYGKSAAKPGPVERPSGKNNKGNRNSDNNLKNNLQKVSDVVGTVSDLNRAKNALTGGGFKAMIPDPITMGGIFLINKLIEKNRQGKDDQVSLMNNLDDNTMQVADVSASDITRLLGLNPYGKQKYAPNQDVDLIRMSEPDLNPTITDEEIKGVLEGTITEPTGQFAADGGRIGAMGGGIMGGLADGQIDEMGRQMYGLGKLVKKVTRAVKKVAKSPIGKAALLYFAPALIPGGASTLGGVFKGMGGLGGLKTSLFGTPGYFNVGSALHGSGVGKAIASTPGILGKLGLTAGGGSMALTGKGITSAISAASLLPLLGIGTGDETEEEAKQLIADNTGLNFDELRPQGPLRFAADGGLMRMGYQEGGDAEPVAKKTMPLIDMDGKEKDYRETGGFVDMGRMERADDVPARLSKNEFVFTADAVRNAGDGNIDKGAEVMYNMMKNLEAGGEVSEESQGLEGARRMFQTSQRLEEVI